MLVTLVTKQKKWLGVLQGAKLAPYTIAAHFQVTSYIH